MTAPWKPEPLKCQDCPSRDLPVKDGRRLSRCNACRARVKAYMKARRSEEQAQPPARFDVAPPMCPPLVLEAPRRVVRARADDAARYAHDNHVTRARAAAKFGVPVADVIVAWDVMFPDKPRIVTNGSVIPWW